MTDSVEYQLSFADLVQSHKEVYVRQITYEEAKPFILGIHYARRMPCVWTFPGGANHRMRHIRDASFSKSMQRNCRRGQQKERI